MALKIVPMEPEDASKTLRLGPFAAQRYRELHGIEDETPGAVAQSDVAQFVATHANCDGASIQFVSWVAHSLLVSTEDHMEGLGRALDESILVFSPATLARGAIEAAAQVWWMLAPASGASGRFSRCMSLQLASAHETTRFLRAAGEDESAGSGLSGLLAESEQIGLKVHRPRRGAPYVENHRPPSATELVASILGGLGGELAYRILSSGAHSTVHAAVGRMPLDRAPDIVEGHAGRGLSRFEIGALTAWTVSAYLSALHRWSAYIGWKTDLVDSLRVLTGVSHLVDAGT